MKYLYKKEKPQEQASFSQERVKVFTPKIFGGLFLPSEKKCVKAFLVRAMFAILTFGKAKIFYVCESGEVAHTSYVVPRCLKFPFLKKGDFEIGPCHTEVSHRGKGLYPMALNAIVHSAGSKGTEFYMIVDESNAASIRGIEKAGFTRCGTVKVNRLTKHYQIESRF